MFRKQHNSVFFTRETEGLDDCQRQKCCFAACLACLKHVLTYLLHHFLGFWMILVVFKAWFCLKSVFLALLKALMGINMSF